MAFKIYLSHSVSPWELGVIYALAEEAERRGMVPFIPDREWEANAVLPPRISGPLMEADSLLSMATSRGRHLSWLNKEIEMWGRLLKARPVIYLTDADIVVQPGLEAYHVVIDRNDLAGSLKEVAAYLEQIKLDKEGKSLLGWLVLAGILFALFSKEK